MQELLLCCSCLSLGENNGAATFPLLSQDFKNQLQAKNKKKSLGRVEGIQESFFFYTKHDIYKFRYFQCSSYRGLEIFGECGFHHCFFHAITIKY